MAKDLETASVIKELKMMKFITSCYYKQLWLGECMQLKQFMLLVLNSAKTLLYVLFHTRITHIVHHFSLTVASKGMRHRNGV